MLKLQMDLRSVNCMSTPNLPSAARTQTNQVRVNWNNSRFAYKVERLHTIKQKQIFPVSINHLYSFFRYRENGSSVPLQFAPPNAHSLFFALISSLKQQQYAQTRPYCRR